LADLIDMFMNSAFKYGDELIRNVMCHKRTVQYKVEKELTIEILILYLA